MRLKVISFTNPENVAQVTSPHAYDGAGFVYNVKPNEYTFWMYRVQQLHITGTVATTDPTDPGESFDFTINLKNVIGDATDEVDAFVNGIWSQNVPTPDPVNGPDVQFIEVVLYAPLWHVGTDNIEGFQTKVGAIISYTPPSPITGGGVIGTDSPLITPSDYTITLQGNNAVIGDAYSHDLDIFFDGINDFVGSMTIEPSVFWAYEDAEGVPLYDTTTGAQIGR